MTILCRTAESGDLPILKRDVKAAFQRSFELELKEQASGLQSVFLALDGDQAVGWGFIHWPGPRELTIRERYPDAPELFRLEVREELRSQGIGGQLMSAMESKVMAESKRQISLGVAHDNPKAYRLYQRLGYQDTEFNEYYDEYQYPMQDGGVGTARDLCRYLVKSL